MDELEEEGRRRTSWGGAAAAGDLEEEGRRRRDLEGRRHGSGGESRHGSGGGENARDWGNFSPDLGFTQAQPAKEKEDDADEAISPADFLTLRSFGPICHGVFNQHQSEK